MSFFGGKGKSKSGIPHIAASSGGGRRPSSSAIESTIGSNTYAKGNIQGDGGLRIDGKVEGNIVLTGNLVITEGAQVKAEIKASNISVAGSVEGNIAANRVEILDTGRVWGDLTVKALLVNEGAYFRGQTFMPNDMQPPQLEPPKRVGSSGKTAELAGPGTVVDVEPKRPSKRK